MENLSLRRRADFNHVLASGKRVRTGGIVVITAPGLPDTFRLGLIASRRTGGAVDRNRAKRRIRHAVRLVAPAPGTDAVVIASRDVVGTEFSRLVAWISAALPPDGGHVGQLGGLVK